MLSGGDGAHLLRDWLREGQQLLDAPPVFDFLSFQIIVLGLEPQHLLALIVEEQLAVADRLLQLLDLHDETRCGSKRG